MCDTASFVSLCTVKSFPLPRQSLTGQGNSIVCIVSIVDEPTHGWQSHIQHVWDEGGLHVLQQQKPKEEASGNCYLSVCAAASFSAGVFCFQHLTALSVELVSTWSLSQTAWEAVSPNMTPLKIDKQVRTHPWLSLLLKSQVELPRSSPECGPQRLQLRGVF